MANLMITTACNLRCPYCFGLEIIGPGLPSQHMEWDTFLEALKWFKGTDIAPGDLHLMGGEPSLHPRFKDMAIHLRKEGWNVVVFSNAAFELPPGQAEEMVEAGVRWVVNVNHPPYYPNPEAVDTLRRHLSLFKRQALLTTNIFPEETDYSFVWDYYDSYDLDRQIKLGIALPTVSKNNSFTDQAGFAQAADRVMEILDQAEPRGISVEFECGVPMCVFNDEQKARLKDVNISHCGSRLDMTPDGRVINCLPLYKVAAHHMSEFGSWEHARAWFGKGLTKYRSLGVFDSCMTCEHLKSGECSACLAYGMGSYNRIAMPEIRSRG